MTIYRDFPKATLCSFCKITVSHRDYGISTVIPNICLVGGGGGIHFLSHFYSFFFGRVAFRRNVSRIFCFTGEGQFKYLGINK
jgi:hypothetical protein